MGSALHRLRKPVDGHHRLFNPLLSPSPSISSTQSYRLDRIPRAAIYAFLGITYLRDAGILRPHLLCRLLR